MTNIPTATPDTPPPLDLAGLYPDGFNWRQPRPLKLEISQDLMAAGYDRKAIRRALGAYCSRVRYLKALRVGVVVLDQPAVQVFEKTTRPAD